jgi:ABC-type maltose transport system permease subunit
VESELNVQAALCVVMMIPSMILFAFFQKTLINGINMSGIKG